LQSVSAGWPLKKCFLGSEEEGMTFAPDSVGTIRIAKGRDGRIGCPGPINRKGFKSASIAR
jgi:hypothetical protein